jgi:hypothetical protein
MNYIHARLFKRSLLVLSVKVAFTLLLPWIRRHEDFYRFTRILCSCTLLPSYAKMPTLLPYPHPMVALVVSRLPLPSHNRVRCLTLIRWESLVNWRGRERFLSSRQSLGLDMTWRSGRQPGTHLSTNFQDNHSARGLGVRARRRKQKARVVLVRSVSLRASSR